MIQKKGKQSLCFLDVQKKAKSEGKGINDVPLVSLDVWRIWLCSCSASSEAAAKFILFWRLRKIQVLGWILETPQQEESRGKENTEAFFWDKNSWTHAGAENPWLLFGFAVGFVFIPSYLAASLSCPTWMVLPIIAKLLSGDFQLKNSKKHQKTLN